MQEDAKAPFALVVDDNGVILMDAADILERVGFRPLMAINGDDAMRQLEACGTEVALLFTDVDMPGSMDGFELARRASKRWPNVGILVASGIVAPSEGDMPDGALFVGKPFSSDVVYQRVHEILPDDQKPEQLKRNHAGSDLKP